MRCTDCSQQVKPVVAIDIDGTLGDYHGHFLKFLEIYLGIEQDPSERFAYQGDLRFSHWCCDIYGITLDEYRRIKLAYRQGAQKRSMPIRSGARALCWATKDADAELWMTTTRPYLSLDGVVPDTEFWLKHHGIEYDGLLFDDDKYEVLAQRIDPQRIVAVLDDIPEMLNSAAILIGVDVPILIRSSYNSAVRATLSTDLDGAADIVLNRIVVWKERYE